MDSNASHPINVTAEYCEEGGPAAAALSLSEIYAPVESAFKHISFVTEVAPRTVKLPHRRTFY